MALTANDLKVQYERLGVAPGSKLAIGVSGGADSLALLMLSAQNFHVTALTINHGLRPEAEQEAAFVADICRKHDLPHVVLYWEGDKPEANIQAEARDARYGLMQDWCEENNISVLAVAHHRDDQAETFLLRLARGSGVYGLAGMPAVRDLGRGVSLVRPLLQYRKQDLTKSLHALKQGWVEDPSNRSENYDRVKVRSLLANPPVEGLGVDRLAATADRLRRSREALEYYEQRWLEKAVAHKPEGYMILSLNHLQSAPEEIILRGLASLCRKMTGALYVPRLEKLLRLYESLRQPDFKGKTLYGVQFAALRAGKVLLVREVSAIEGQVPLEKTMIWDNRFAIAAKGDISGLTVAPLKESGWSRLKAYMPDFDQIDMPRLACLALPTIYQGTELQAVPHLGYNKLKDVTFEVSLRYMS